MHWLSILKCPIEGNRLRLLTVDELSSVNDLIASRKVWRLNGDVVTNPIEKALIEETGRYLFPIVNEIVILIKDLALVFREDDIRGSRLDVDKQKVRDFYDQKGWFADQGGNYEDAVIYEDLRDVSKDYLMKCHDRVARYLNPSGTYILDAASGAIQYTDYLQYSENYKYRVCVDFSFQALSEAKRKLGKKGIYILADITNLPFQDNVMDSFVSLNTIYHIPKDEQVTAIKELYRVLAPSGKGVVVYDWFKHSAWMNFWLLPFRGFVFIKNRFLDAVGRILGTKGAERRLYFYAHSQAYFKKHLPAHRIAVWRTLSVHFMRYYIHSWLFGERILDLVYKKEEREPEKCGLNGEYPMLVFEK